jgi:oxygen-independent coproporphyrinogen-3 oxidase
MIKIYLPGEAYYYDVQALTKAFFPMEELEFVFEAEKKREIEAQESTEIKFIFNLSQIEISLERNGKLLYQETSPQITEEDEELKKKQYKNEVKRILYRCLSESFQRKLDWGTLTGVRPTKIPMQYYIEGIKEEEIYRRMAEEYYLKSEKVRLCCEIAKRELSLLQTLDYEKGYSIYIGIPFCPTTCLYCSFTSYPYERFVGEEAPYLKALFKEIDYAKDCLPEKKLETVYIGGGTPTALCTEAFESLLKKIKETLDFTYVKEFTVEAGRPDSITKEKLLLMKQYGVDRISINPQTMKDETLERIGRGHTVEQICSAFWLARECGHENINMDLIVGLPGETKEDVENTLKEIEKLNPDSITIHALVTKRAARLNQNRELRDCVNMDEMVELGQDFCRKHGYFPYYMYRQKNTTGSSHSANQENIGYARVGKEGLYNILIMEEKQTIVALGAGASSKFVFPGENRVERVENVKSLTDYISRVDEMIDRKRNLIEREYR